MLILSFLRATDRSSPWAQHSSMNLTVTPPEPGVSPVSKAHKAKCSVSQVQRTTPLPGYDTALSIYQSPLKPTPARFPPAAKPSEGINSVKPCYKSWPCNPAADAKNPRTHNTDLGSCFSPLVFTLLMNKPTTTKTKVRKRIIMIYVYFLCVCSWWPYNTTQIFV